MGVPVLDARKLVLRRGITINGLPIMLHADYFSGYSIPDLDVYYEECVIGGPGAFLITVQSMERIEEAIRRKLVQEIAGTSAKIVPAAFPALKPEPRIDCQIGEKLRRRWYRSLSGGAAQVAASFASLVCRAFQRPDLGKASKKRFSGVRLALRRRLRPLLPIGGSDPQRDQLPDIAGRGGGGHARL